MKLPLDIVLRNMVPLPSMKPQIRRRAAKLEPWRCELTTPIAVCAHRPV